MATGGEQKSLRRLSSWLVALLSAGSLALLSMLLIPLHASGIQSNADTNSNSAYEYLAYYIIFEMQTDGSIHPLMYQQVQLAATLNSLDGREIASRLRWPDRSVQQIVVILKSNNEETVYQNIIEVPRWLRGEFHAGRSMATQTAIDGHFLPLKQPIFVVRVPAIADALLVIQNSKLITLAQFNLDQLATETPKIVTESRRQSISQASPHGDPANRVDLLIMGDGYTTTQQAKFISDATSVLDSFLSISPYASYRNYVNVPMLFTLSNQAGADHPPYQAGCQSQSCCGDPSMESDPLQGIFVNTAFDAKFCTENIHRLLTVDGVKVLAAAAVAPDWDEIIVIVNDATYGGSGGIFAVTSLHEAAPQIAQHEYGHSFTGLADEYETAYPGYPFCSDITSPPCEANVTDVMTPTHQIKWSPWISPSTPIPTIPEFDPQFADVVGLFEGARYRTTGMYRPGQNCIMRTLGAPYCQIPSEAYVLRLYTGGWGNPSSGIRLIEPNTAFPITNAVTLWYPNRQTFRADILQPSGSPPVSIRWMVNGSPTDVHTNTYTYTPTISDIGNNISIQLLVVSL